MANQIDVPVTQVKKELKVPQISKVVKVAPVVQQGQVEQTPMEGKSNKWWLWSLIGLIVGAGLTVAYFLLLKK